MSHELATANKILEMHLSSAEFDAAVARNKLLHDCKTKGFKRLQALGWHAGGVDIKEKPKVVRMDPYEFATMGANLVNARKITIAAWADQCGRNPGDLRYYCNKFGIELVRKTIATDEREKIYVKARQMINRYGNRLNVAAQRCGVSATFLHDLFKSKGRVYNSKTIKIERIKK